MAVQSIRGSEGKTRGYKMATSTTIVANTFLTFSSGLVIPATSATTSLILISREDKVSTSDTPEILCEEIDETVVMLIDTDADTSQALVGTKVDLLNASTLHPAGTTTKVLFVKALVGATTDRKLLVSKVSKDA